MVCRRRQAPSVEVEDTVEAGREGGSRPPAKEELIKKKKRKHEPFINRMEPKEEKILTSGGKQNQDKVVFLAHQERYPAEEWRNLR